MFRSYHGCSFDGNNANRFLNLLDQLELDILAAAQLDASITNLIPIITCLRAFNCLKKDAFGHTTVKPTLSVSVENFKASYESLISVT